MFIENVRNCNKRETLGNVMRREKHLKGILKVMDSSLAAERLFKHLCDKGMIEEAKVEAVKLSTLHNYDKNIKIYFLAICSFYEDDEEKFHDYFNQVKATEDPFLSNIESRYQLCDSIADIYANISKGDEMFKKGLYKKAIEFYLKAQNNTDIIPLLSSKLLLKIGLAKRELKDKSSFLYFHESLKIKNDNHEALAARGECLLQEGKFELALKDFVRAEKIFPCRRYAELIIKAKEEPEDNPAASDQEKSNNSKQISESRRKAVKKKEEGNRFFQNEDFREAIKCYSEAIEIDNSDDAFFCNRAACYINLRKFDDAVKDCEKALELNPSSAKGHFRLGQCYLAKGEINEAVSSLEKALKVKPKDVIVQKELQSAKDVIKNIDKANKLFDDKRYEEAGKMFSSILEIAKSAFNIYNKCMECYMRLGRFQDAINAGDSIFYPYGNFQYYYLLGICYLHERMLYYANRCFKDALERDPTNETLKSVLEYLREKSEYFDYPDNKESEEVVQKILSKLSNTFGSFSTESDHDLAKNKTTEGDSYFEKEKYRDALHCYTEALSVVPLNCSLYVSRASCYIKMKKFKDAISEIKEALDIDGKCLEAFKLLGNIETMMGNTEKAKSAFKEAENLCPQNEKDVGLVKVLKLESILEEADRARDSGRLEKAMDLYKEALKISPASHCIYEKYGECHLQLKQYACFPFEDIFHLVEEWDEFQWGTKYYLEGRLYYLYGDGVSSIKNLEDAVQNNPSNEKYKKWLNTVRSVFGFIDKTMGALTQNDLQASLDYLNEAIQISEDSPFLSSKISYFIGFVKCKQKKLDEAIEWFTKSRDILREKTDFHTPYAEYNEKIWGIKSKLKGEDRRRSVPLFKERKFKETVKIIRQTLVSSLEKRAYCYKLQGDYRNAVKDYEELYSYTAETEYRSISDVLRRSKKVR
ncbi:Small glutamine-rich tetratricopeptide repeat-containing protein beta [Armadillidium vulgare]|nr:Small glutamine-rich tetratricopeptide repeat-containing protein beta [Armadillidium vulgare]